MKKALFIYGYGGSPKHSTFKDLLSKRLKDMYEMHCIEYTQTDCVKALNELADYIADNGIELVIGVSLGGFLAAALETKVKKFKAGKVARIIINPCWWPTDELPKLTPRPGHPEDVQPSEEMVGTYEHTECLLCCAPKYLRGNVYGFFAKDDELFGDRFVFAFERHYGEGSATIVRGGHHGSKEAADDISKMILENNI